MVIEGTLIQRILEQGWGRSHGSTASYHACPGTLWPLDLSPPLTPGLLLLHLAFSCLPTEWGFSSFLLSVFFFRQKTMPLTLLLALHHVNYPQSPTKGGTETRYIIRKWALFPLEVGQQNLHLSNSISILRATCKENSANCS